MRKNIKLRWIVISVVLMLNGCSQDSDREAGNSGLGSTTPASGLEAIQKINFEFSNLLPRKVYGTPGLPIEVYFRNLAPGFDDEEFFITTHCSCEFGRKERRKWIGVPTQSDIGEHTLSIFMKRRGDGKGFSFKTSLVVSKESTDIKSLRLLLVGDSITRQQQYPNRLVRYLKKRLDVNVSTFGKISLDLSPYDPGFFEPADEGVFIEAYNGWNTPMFLNDYWVDSSSANNDSDVSRSPFLFGETRETGELSLSQYVDKYGDSQYPDIVIVMLGTNDVFSASSLQPDSQINGIKKSVGIISENILKLIDFFRSDGVSRPVLVVTPPPSSFSKLAAEFQYGDVKQAIDLNASTLLLGHHLVTEFKPLEKKKINVVSNYIGFDPLDGYLQDQMVHPSNSGHEQIANQVYSRLAGLLNDPDYVDAIIDNRK